MPWSSSVVCLRSVGYILTSVTYVATTLWVDSDVSVEADYYSILQLNQQLDESNDYIAGARANQTSKVRVG